MNVDATAKTDFAHRPIEGMSKAEAMGLLVGTCLFGRVHLNWTVDDLGRLFMPPLSLNQFAIWVDGGRPIGFATWAFLTDATLSEILPSGRGPRPNEWQNGERLFIVDFVAPFGHAAMMTRDLQRRIFPELAKEAFSIRRDRFGRALRVCRWPTLRQLKRDSG